MAWYDVPEFRQFPIWCRLWLLWCKRGPKRRDYGTAGGNFFFKCICNYYNRFPSGHRNLVPILFDRITTVVFMDIVDKQTFQHSAQILSNGSAETDLLKIILENGDTFIDVGANIGTLSLHGAKLVGDRGRVIAVEPQPRLAEALRMTKIYNKLDQLEVIEAAAGEDGGRVELYPSTGASGTASLIRHEFAGNTPYFVKLITVDEIVDNSTVGIIRLLKVDVEGAELKVFRGSQEILRAFAPFISFEINPSFLASAGIHHSKIISFLHKFSYCKFYDVASVANGPLIEIEEPTKLINVLAIHSTREVEFRQKLARFSLAQSTRYRTLNRYGVA